MATDASARVADGALVGDGVDIGPYCLVGPDVELKDGVRLIAHVNVTGATRIGEATVVYPFASLGTPPQSVRWRRRNPSRRPLLLDGRIACRA
jgi:UDP-N-acetylglucosamine acyltransferase